MLAWIPAFAGMTALHREDALNQPGASIHDGRYKIALGENAMRRKIALLVLVCLAALDPSRSKNSTLAMRFVDMAPSIRMRDRPGFTYCSQHYHKLAPVVRLSWPF